MKKFVISFLIMLSAVASAHFDEDAKSLFLKDEKVQAIIEKYKEQDYTVEDAQLVYLRGGCGFVGCTSIYLVTAGVYPNFGANTQHFSVGAIVVVPTFGESEVQLIDTNKIDIQNLSLGQEKP